ERETGLENRTNKLCERNKLPPQQDICVCNNKALDYGYSMEWRQCDDETLLQSTTSIIQCFNATKNENIAINMLGIHLHFGTRVKNLKRDFLKKDYMPFSFLLFSLMRGVHVLCLFLHFRANIYFFSMYQIDSYYFDSRPRIERVFRLMLAFSNASSTRYLCIDVENYVMEIMWYDFHYCHSNGSLAE
ncbi:hypothetical protein ACJX0J_029598, partial [Zea mays]